MPNLEVVEVAWGLRLSAEELIGLEKLRSLRLGAACLNWKNPRFEELHQIDGLIDLDMGSRQIPRRILEPWADSGNLGDQRYFASYRRVDFAKLPRLESARLYRNDKQRDAFEIEKLGNHEHLTHFSLYRATQAEVDAIASFPNQENIRKLEIRGPDFDSVDSVSVLQNLENFQILGGSENFKKLDLEPFENLKYTSIRSAYGLQTIRGLTNHPNLRSLTVDRCRELRNFGEIGGQSKLQLLKLYYMDQIESLEAFGEASNLPQIQMWFLNGLKEPVGVDLDSIDHVYIYSCGEFEDRVPVK